jgi:hypothetical protein
MKNKLVAKVMGNEIASKIIGEVGRFYINHESVILTTGTIGFSWAATAITMKNSMEIHYILADCRDALQNCNTKEERNHVYSLTLKSLVPLVLPILLFEGASTACAIFSKKQYDKKLAEAAGALSIAQAAITQYQLFQKEAEQALGKEKYLELQDDIYKDKNQDFKGSEQVFRKFNDLPYEGLPGEDIFVCKYSGRPFWSTSSAIECATERFCYRLGSKGGYDRQTINDWYDIMGNPSLTPTELTGQFGYYSYASDDGDEITAHFSPTQVVFPNGIVKPAFEVTLYPEPAFIDKD